MALLPTRWQRPFAAALLAAALLATMAGAGIAGTAGDQFQLSETDGSDPQFDAAGALTVHNPQTNQTLVVWAADDPENGSEPDTDEEAVFVRLVDAAGNPVGAQKRVSDLTTSRFARSMDATYNPDRNEFLVVWSGGIGTDEDIFAQVLDAGGNEIGTNAPADIPVAVTGQDLQSPTVAYNSAVDEYLVLFGDNSASEIRAQRLDPSGVEVGSGDDYFLTDVPEDADSPELAYDPVGGGYFAVWEHGVDGSGSRQVFGTLVDSAGVAQGSLLQVSNQSPIGRVTSDIEVGDLDIVYNAVSSEYLVVWDGARLVNEAATDDPFDELEVYVQRLNRAGAELGGDVRVTAQGPDDDAEFDAEDARVAHDSVTNRYMVVWEGDAHVASGDDDVEAFATCLDATAAVVEPAFRLSTHGADGDPLFDVNDPAAAFNPVTGAFLTAWDATKSFDTATSNDEREIFTRRATCATAGAPAPPAPPAPVPLTLAQLNATDPPTLGRNVNVGPVRGQVFVAVPGQGAGTTAARGRSAATVPGLKGVRFVPLTEARQIPVGSYLDTRRGTVDLFSARDRSRRRLQSGRFLQGVFQVLQSRARSQKGLTELRLKGSSFNRCRARGAVRSEADGQATTGRANAAQLSRRTIRRLRANAKGRFRTRGRHSAATVRGTVWITTDRCDGTLTQVKRGKVAVRDLRRKRTITLTAGKSYLARAPR